MFSCLPARPARLRRGSACGGLDGLRGLRGLKSRMAAELGEAVRLSGPVWPACLSLPV